MKTHNRSKLPVAITLALGLSLPCVAHAMAPPQQAPDPAPDPAIEVQPVDADAQLPVQDEEPSVAQPTTQLHAAPAPPPPVAATPQYDRSPAYDHSPPAKPNRGLGLTIAGFSIFGATYIPMLALSAGGPILAIPVAGPVIAGVDLLTFASEGGSVGGPLLAMLGVVLIFDGVAQGVGLGLGITGAVTLGKARHQARLSASPGGLRLQF